MCRYANVFRKVSLLEPCICYIVAGKTFGASARGNEAICQHGFFNGHEEEKHKHIQSESEKLQRVLFF